MSEVRLTIGGRDYTVACADGEEAHVAHLGEAIDAKFQQLGGNLSNKEAQNLLFAALLLADEVHEQRSSSSRSGSAANAQADGESALRNAEQLASAAQAELDAMRADMEDWREQETALRVELENLKSERDALSEEASRLRAEARSQSVQTAAATGTLFDDPELAPALERFADLLENCADKLESRLSAS